MRDINSLLRQIPKVDELLSNALLGQYVPGPLLTHAVREVLDGLRSRIKDGQVDVIPCPDVLAGEAAKGYCEYQKPNLRRLINGTGIILHTNLGRAPLAEEALDAIREAARDYSNLEYCVLKGERSSRHVHVEGLITGLTGAEAAMVVNNNAAAVLLALSAVGQKDVIVSRGELVEIGGSFRVPDVLAQSGCRLIEVGTTNKTHIRDYEAAVEPGRTGAFLRVHTSNFIMSGFVSKPGLEELSDTAIKHSVPLIEDLGSGCMINLAEYGIHGQPVIADSIKAGVDIVTFSGDKLLGGPQAGIIAGRAEWIAKMKSHPLARAMRIDKLCLAALEATLRLYFDPLTVVEKIPTLQMLCESTEKLNEKAQMLKSLLADWAEITIVTESSLAGGGAMPEEGIATVAVAIDADIPAQALERHFRTGSVPIIGRISKDRLILDMRTLSTEDFPYITARLKTAQGET
ncbi:MAG: L-seryl-tRNA(Sec) selenium transferase [Defluviitaleaceae bacterium]|nr:L-seryl-tRNA(Sec) selenium transferase [Defluviitaleaceae bacterium]